ncbi:MAG: antitoxin component YwqK of YwqJK toxin-antitoxin module [Chlamydiales bacterium]|jgi:antitoxin component YwqK of YwqJK toxin-antitoxin module
MTIEKYSFQNSLIEIIDDELDINIRQDFSPPLLPEKLEENMELEQGHTLQLTYADQKKNNIYSAFIKKGDQLSGQYRTFYPNGNVESESYYSTDSNLHGPSTCFSQEGKILSKSWFLNGKQIGKAHSYFASGNLYSSLQYKDDLQHLRQVYYYDNGSPKTILPFTMGKLNGTCTLYHANGIVFREILYKNNTKDGLEQEWNPKGEKRAERLFNNNTLLKEQRWNSNNKLVDERVFLEKTSRVNFKKWSSEGTLIKMGSHEGELAHFQSWDNKGNLTLEFKGSWDGEIVRLEKVLYGDISPDVAAKTFSWEAIES